jgi:multicomponent Na+:H+ antiporter subunit B
MSSIILRTAARTLQPVLLLYAVFLLLVGHNEPGGGFVGGLVASAAVSLYAITHGVKTARHLIPFEPRTLIACGLSIALASGVLSLFGRQPFMTGQWLNLSPNGPAIGTPLLFDVGVFVLVIGAALLMILSLAAEEE